MIPITYLTENFMDCNENFWHGVNKNPLFIPMCFGTKQKVRKWQQLLFTFSFHVVPITFKLFQIIFSIEYQHTLTVECCAGHLNSQIGYQYVTCGCKFDFLAIPFDKQGAQRSDSCIFVLPVVPWV